MDKLALAGPKPLFVDDSDKITPSEMAGWSVSGATLFLGRTFVGSESRAVHEDLADSQDVKALLEVQNA